MEEIQRTPAEQVVNPPQLEKDVFDRGRREGAPLAEQPPGHLQAESPPKQLDPSQDRYIHLPSLISDEFGTPRSEARMQIALGRVEVDGKEISGDKFDLRYDEIAGKTVHVFGPNRQYKIDYRG